MYHDGNFEIIIVLKGVIHLDVDSIHYSITEGEVFALPPYHHLHGYRESPEGTQYFWFHFFTKPNGLRTQEVDLSKTHVIESMFTKTQAILPLQFEVSDFDKVFILANQILDMAKSDYFTSIGTDYFLTSLIIELSQEYFTSIISTPLSEEEARIDGIKEWIRSNLTDKLRVGDVADHFELNPHYLVRIFKQQTGQTVIQFINGLKLQKARELLLRTNLPIKQIASMAFFPDEKRFMKVFKENGFLTPSEYRRGYTKKFLDSSKFDPEVPITRDTEDYQNRFKKINCKSLQNSKGLNHMNKRKGRMNLLIMIIIIVVIDLIFLGYQHINKDSKKSSSATSPVRVSVVSQHSPLRA
nr:AraC family transcriptional regulator [Lentilactobacillus otakiensis]